jgi:hypothetical protein
MTMEGQMWISVLMAAIGVPVIIGTMLFGMHVPATSNESNSPYAGM